MDEVENEKGVPWIEFLWCKPNNTADLLLEPAPEVSQFLLLPEYSGTIPYVLSRMSSK